MAHNVFISHSSKDKAIADAICANLEDAGVRCWIAPRDIAPGDDWPRAIAGAISQSRVMVLIFSTNANSSDQISRELSVAADYNLAIIPFKIDNVKPEPGKQYFLSNTHWLDAMNPPTQKQINLLVERVKSIIPEAGTGNLIKRPLPTTEPKDASLKSELQASDIKRHRGAVKSVAFSRRAAIIVGLIVLGIGLFAVFAQSLSAISAQSFVTSTSTRKPTSTFTPTHTPTIAPTLTPTFIRPTPIPTLDQRILNPANQHLYLFVDIWVHWLQAKDYCAARGGHLVTIHDDPENIFVYNLIGDNTWTWLGATQAKPGFWQWVTGQPLTFTKWGLSGPPKDPTQIYLKTYHRLEVISKMVKMGQTPKRRVTYGHDG